MTLCERCCDEIERGITLPEWALSSSWSVGGEVRHVSPLQRCIFKVLWGRRGKVVRREGLMTILYGARPDPPDPLSLSVPICRLREHLRSSGWGIVPEYGQGWMLVPETEAESHPGLKSRRAGVEVRRQRRLDRVHAEMVAEGWPVDGT